MKPGDLVRVRSVGRLGGKIGLILEHRHGASTSPWVVLVDGKQERMSWFALEVIDEAG